MECKLNDAPNLALGIMYKSIEDKFKKYVKGGKKNTNLTPKKKKRKKK
jgi:hypothetical protein